MLALFNALIATQEMLSEVEEKLANQGLVLKTNRLTLIPYKSNLITTKHLEWLNDKELMKYSEQRHQEHTRKTQEEYLNNFPEGSFIWLIQRKQEPIMDIGTITAYVDPYNGVADMGILIGHGHQSKRYGQEAWNSVRDFLLRGNIRKITCGCRSDNMPMRNIAHHAGFSFEGCRQNHFLDDNDNPHDLMQYAYHNKDWKPW